MMFISGAIIGALALYLVMKKKLPLGAIVFMVLGIALLAFTVQNYAGFGRELEPVAQNFILMTMGIPGVICLALAAWLARRKQAASR